MYCGGGGGGGGGAGTRGGGAISLVAKNSLVVSGRISTNALTGAGNADKGSDAVHEKGGPGGRGGHAGQTGERLFGQVGNPKSGCDYGAKRGGAGRNGHVGAGGGILLKCSGPWGVLATGTFDTRGSGSANFGSTKIFGVKGRVNSSGNLYTGWNNSYGNPLVQQNEVWIHPVG